MADEYTLKTEDVRGAWAYAATGHESDRTAQEAYDLFDRWLESEREAVRQELRERIAQDIEAVDPIEWALAGQRAGEDAARIARGATR